MKQLALILILAVLIVVAPPLFSRTATDNSLGIDEAKLEEIIRMIGAIDEQWAGHSRKCLEMLSIVHSFPVGEVVPGPVSVDNYRHYLGGRGTSKGSMIEGRTGLEKSNEFLYQNLVLEVIKPADRTPEEVTAEERLRGISIDEIVRFTYDFVIVFDEDTSDDMSYRIIMPMDVTVHGESTYGPRAEDDCTGWWSEYRLLEASYGPLEMITVRPD